MSKEKINEKLEELYGLEPCVSQPKLGKLYLIDDSARLFDLAVQHKIGFVAMNNVFLAGCDSIEIIEYYSGHETPSDAAKYAIAMALIELKR